MTARHPATRLLMIEDDDTLRETLAEHLRAFGFEVASAATAAEGEACFRRGGVDAVVLDLRLPDADGLDLLTRLRGLDDTVPVIIMTAYPETRSAVSAIRAGAYDYLNKPFELAELRELIERALRLGALEQAVARDSAGGPQAPGDGHTDASPAIHRLGRVIDRLAQAPWAPVLIYGESGVGKEWVAQAVHSRSARAEGPWVPVNCAAIAEGLVESEVFGHERGAFTGAEASRRGLLELAHGGTLFLDEIAELPLALQPKLLRALETQRFRRVGGQQERQVDLRIVAATHRDLAGMVAAGEFRADLFYRLNVGQIYVPPLRERPEDIPALVARFLCEAAERLDVPPPRITPPALECLERHPWPGNVRELRNAVERAVIVSGAEEIRPEHLPDEIAETGPGVRPAGSDGSPRRLSLSEAELDHVRRVLDACGGNKSEAARVLGISRTTLREKLRHDPPSRSGEDAARP